MSKSQTEAVVLANNLTTAAATTAQAGVLRCLLRF